MHTGRKIFKNMVSLSVAELASKGIVFLWTAVLARELGKDGMGMIGFAQTFTNYFILFITLSFNTVGAREIAKAYDKINRYVNTIITLRLSLAVLSYIVMAVIVYFMDRSGESKIIIMISGGSLFANAILLDWVYQGTERMEILALRQVIVNVLNLTGILLLVNGREDAVLAMGIITTALIINSLWMAGVYVKLFGPIKLKLDFELVRFIARSAIPLAVSNLFITILNTFNILILGFLKGDEATGIYFVAYKLMILSLLPSTAIQFAFFPVLSRAQSAEERKRIVSKFALLLAAAGSITTVLLFTYSDFVINTAFSSEFDRASNVLKILMASSFFAYMNISLNVPLVAWQKEKQAMTAVIIGCSFNIALNFLLIPEYSYYGAAIAALASEIGVFSGLSFFFYKNIRKHYFLYFLKLLIISALSGAAGHYLMNLNIHPVAAIVISFIIFAGIVFALKIISIEDIKKYIIVKK